MVYNAISFAGLFILLLIAWLFSWDRRRVNFRLIAVGLSMQILFGLFVFVFPAGVRFFLLINDAVNSLIQASSAGTEFVFGRLALPPGSKNAFGEESLGFFLAFQALPSILFFSALMSLLYYLKVIPFIVKIFARIFSALMGISGAESLSASSNIFVGVESTLTIKPYLANMTRSELGTVLTAGMATVASNVLAIYVFNLQSTFPGIAGHLVSASILSAPAAIVISKLMMPETGTPETMGVQADIHMEGDSSFIEAIINGANQGMKLVLGIIALLVAVLGLVALIDSMFGGVAMALGFSPEKATINTLLAYLFWPITIILGVPLEDVTVISGILGERLLLTEVASYMHLASAVKEGLIHNGRSVVIASYALCGFAHMASLSIFVGGVAALVPGRTKDLAAVSFRALFSATLATLMTGAIAGMMYTDGQGLIQF